MKKGYLKLIYISLIILAFWLGMKAERKMSELFDNKDLIERTQIHFKDKMTSLFLKTDRRDYENPQTVLTTELKLEFNPNNKTEYVFKGSYPLVYKVNKDTLKIYCRKKPIIPENFNSEIHIKIIEINDNDEWKLLIEKTKNEFKLF